MPIECDITPGPEGNAGVGNKNKREKQPEVYFVWPPQEDTITIKTAGLVIIDFYTGIVKLKNGASVDGSVPQLQGSLEAAGRDYIRSLHLETDKKIRFYTDVVSPTNLIPVKANDVWETEMQEFKILYIYVLSTNTTLSLIGSTSLIGFKPIMTRAPSTFKGGQKTVTTSGTAEQLSSTSVPIRGVTIVALKDNTGYVYLGDSTVDSSGDKLWPGDSRNIAIDNLNRIWLDVSVSGEGVTYSYVA